VLPREPQTLDQLLGESRDRAGQYALWLAELRASDEEFEEASTLYPADMNEWQAATYLLTGCEQVWNAVKRHVLCDLSLAAVTCELDQPRRAWSSSEGSVMRWAAHFWDVDRSTVTFPYVFGRFYFHRWITACHLYKRMPPAATTANGSSR
jgi:hypothetical protein